MASAPHTPDPETNHDQPSMEIDWLSGSDLSVLDLDTHCSALSPQTALQTMEELSALLDLDGYYSDSPQSIEEPHLEIESTVEEMQETSKDIQQTRNASRRISDEVASMPLGSTMSQPSELFAQASPRSCSGRSEGNSKPLAELEQKTEDRLRLRRCKLQKGLLPEMGQPKADEKYQELADSSDAKQLLDNHGKAAATGLTEECQPEMIARSGPSCKSTTDHSIEAGVISANEDPPLPASPVLAAQSSSKPRPERLVIDLTDDGEAGIDVGSELPHQPTHLSSGPGVLKSAQTIGSSLPLDSHQSISCHVFKNKVSPSPSTSGSGSKRKWSDASSGQNSSVSGVDTDVSDTSYPGNLQSSTAAAKPIKKLTPNRPRTHRKTSPRQHLTNEILWMTGSVPKIEAFIEEAEREIEAIGEKRDRLLEENAAEMEAAMSRKDELVDLKEYLLGWGAQDEKVTEEWVPSR